MSSKVCTIPILFFSLLLTLPGCKKKNTDPDFTAKIGGTRHWYGSHFYESIGTHTYEHYSITDTTLTVIAVDGSTICIINDTLLYRDSDPVAECHNFGTKWGRYDDSLKYYYNKDSIAFHHAITHGTWQLREDFYTK